MLFVLRGLSTKDSPEKIWDYSTYRRKSGKHVGNENQENVVIEILKTLERSSEKHRALRKFEINLLRENPRVSRWEKSEKHM
jgi:hypothetical protein